MSIDVGAVSPLAENGLDFNLRTFGDFSASFLFQLFTDFVGDFFVIFVGL
jgi:hypothetical protein